MKIFRHEPYMTPNNYDIYFDTREIPVNIPVETAGQLERRLQKLMPLTKKIHVNLEEKNLHGTNNISCFTKLKMNNIEVKFL